MADVLVLFGFFWMVVAAFIGLFLAKRHELTLGDLERIAAKGNLIEYHRVSEGYKWNKTVHAHAFLFSVVSVVIGLAMPGMKYPVPVIEVLAMVQMLSVVLWTLGGIRSSRPLMVIGDLSLMASIVATVIGLARAL